jgi:hypothetical protein
MVKPKLSILAKLESYFSKYVAAPSDYHFVAALWASMTYIYRSLDTVPYLCVTAMTKRSGKTLFAVDLLGPVCSQAMNATGMSGPVLWRKMEENDGGVFFVDEAESLSSEAGSKLRSALNIGYKRGQTVPIVVGGKVVDMPVFGPKCFVLIGDVNDTLRDRSIVLYMRRATPEATSKLARFVSVNVEAEAAAIGAELGEVMAENAGAILEAYHNADSLEWLSARDAEIWLSLFAICSILAPERVEELKRIATDLSADKGSDAMKFSAESAQDAEKKAERAEYCVRLIKDLATICGARKYVTSEEVVGALKAIPTAPWRRYKGRGLNDQDIGYLLPPRMQAKNIKVATKPKQIVRRGWMKKDLDAALLDIGIIYTELDA